MTGIREHIPISAGSSFRVLRWDHNLREVDVISQGKKTEPISGEGNHWHFHREMEMTLSLTGEGTRFVSSDIRPIGSHRVRVPTGDERSCEKRF